MFGGLSRSLAPAGPHRLPEQGRIGAWKKQRTASEVGGPECGLGKKGLLSLGYEARAYTTPVPLKHNREVYFRRSQGKLAPSRPLPESPAKSSQVRRITLFPPLMRVLRGSMLRGSWCHRTGGKPPSLGRKYLGYPVLTGSGCTRRSASHLHEAPASMGTKPSGCLINSGGDVPGSPGLLKSPGTAYWR